MGGLKGNKKQARLQFALSRSLLEDGKIKYISIGNPEFRSQHPELKKDDIIFILTSGSWLLNTHFTKPIQSLIFNFDFLPLIELTCCVF